MLKEGGAPVVGARVRISEIGNWGGDEQPDATTDNQGRFHFDNLDPGRTFGKDDERYFLPRYLFGGDFD